MWRNVLPEQATYGLCVGLALPGETQLDIIDYLLLRQISINHWIIGYIKLMLLL